jgi:hypothetical protein
MRISKSLLGVVANFPLLGTPALADPPKEDKADAEKAIHTVRDKLYDAAIRKDRSALEERIAEDYFGITYEGVPMRKADRVRMWSGVSSSLLSHSITDSKIRFQGDLAFETCRTNFSTEDREHRRYGGSTLDTNIYRKTPDGWVVSWQQSSLTPKRNFSPEKVPGQHTFWGHTSGHFKNTEGKNWEESVSGQSYRFVERERTSDYVELYDESRNCTVRLYDNRCEVKGAFTNHEFQEFYYGEWGSE